jgi:hypothetical protein
MVHTTKLYQFCSTKKKLLFNKIHLHPMRGSSMRHVREHDYLVFDAPGGQIILGLSEGLRHSFRLCGMHPGSFLWGDHRLSSSGVCPAPTDVPPTLGEPEFLGRLPPSLSRGLSSSSESGMMYSLSSESAITCESFRFVRVA